MNPRVEALLVALNFTKDKNGVQKLLNRCIKKKHLNRVKYVKKELARISLEPDVVTPKPARVSEILEDLNMPPLTKDQLMMRVFDGDGATGEELYKCYVDGLNSKEISKISGQKAPWVKAARYAKQNGLEYPIGNKD